MSEEEKKEQPLPSQKLWKSLGETFRKLPLDKLRQIPWRKAWETPLAALRKIPFKGAFFAAGGVILLVLVLISPLFHVQTVTVAGNEIVATADILAASGLESQSTTNILLVMPGQIAKQLEALPYIKTAEVVREFPDTVRMLVTERKAYGYVEFASQQLLLKIDDEGMVLSTQVEAADNLLVFSGLDFADFSVGRLLEPKNQESFDTAIQLAKLFAETGFETATRADVTDVKNIHIHVQDVDVLFGSMSYAATKVLILKELAANHIPQGYRGFMDMRNVTDKSDLEKISMRPLK